MTKKNCLAYEGAIDEVHSEIEQAEALIIEMGSGAVLAWVVELFAIEKIQQYFGRS